MLKKRVIPCMLYNGLSLVKTIQFGQMRNLGSPIQAARVYNQRNVDELIFIDLMATAEGRAPLFNIIADIVKECFMPLTIGGGVHSLDDIQKLLAIGADKISINSEALQNPDFITQAAKRFGSQCIVVSIDAKRVGTEYHVFKKRGTADTGLEAGAWAKQIEKLGAGEILLTSVDNDGKMEGYDLELIKHVTGAVAVPLIACGGAGKAMDLVDAVKAGASAVSLASMFHYSGHTANSLKERMAEAGLPVRIVRDRIIH